MLLRALTILCLCGSFLAPAQAEELSQDHTVDIEMFRPPADAYGYFSTQSAATLSHLQFGGGFWGHYSNDALILVEGGLRVAPVNVEVVGDDGDGVIDDRVMTHVQLGLGMSRYFSISADIPLILWQDGFQLNGIDNPTEAPRALIVSALSDVKVMPKLVLADRDYLPIGAALAVPVSVPTGNGGSFLGEEAYTVQPTLALEFSNGSIHNRDYTFRTAFNLGYRVRDEGRLRDVTVGNEFVYGAAIGVHPVEPVELTVDFHGGVFGERSAQQPAEILGGLKFLLGKFVILNIGGGAGVMSGLGAPDYRVFAGVNVAPSFDPNARDRDKDGIVDAHDQCVKEPEDIDGWQDENGCPELDNDADGIEDNIDQCPNDHEDVDGFQDLDGCPDADNDKDQILDVADQCPDEPEAINGYQDEDGCPDTKPIEDSDGDGYKDDVDMCPFAPEDFDAWEDEDGCPEDDNDGDSILDINDACPNEREVFNEVEDEDGCPDESQRVVVRDAYIEINDRIYFEFAKADIQRRSYGLLNEIASVILANSDITKIRVEGHTDAIGDDISNLKLSQARASSVVDYLVNAGVKRRRLDPVGFGEMRPVSDNETDEGRQANRRVEFIIVSREASE